MGAAGMVEVQVGIEALSSRLLKKLNKGVTAIQNLEIMKHCETPGLPALAANLIMNFPASDQADVDETLATLAFALHTRPLKAIPFWLGRGSPVSGHPEAFGIQRVRNHPFYAYLFPPAVLKTLRLMIQGHRGCLREQQRLWQPVRKAVREWEKTYSDLHRGARSSPLLSFLDGGDFLMIFERRHRGKDMTHRLRGASRKVYLFCSQNRHASELLGRFPGLGTEKIFPFLHMMVDKKLMFREGERFLSLAVPVRGFRTRK